MKRKYPLSVSLIARNEEVNLPRCLDGLHDWVSEIIVVINDCTDDTAAVAHRYGATVAEHAWQDYRTQKNHSLALCTQPWVLCLDADEVVDEELTRSIKAFLDHQGNGHASAYFARLSYFMGRWIRHGDWYPDYCLRLVKRDSANWAGASDHTRLETPGKSQRLQGHLLHYSYPNIEVQLRKIAAQGNDFVNRQAEHSKQKSYNAAGVAFRALWRFVRGYFLRQGFRDGFPGFYIAAANAFGTLYKYTRYYESKQSSDSSLRVD